MFEPGTQIGRYEIQRRLGRGGMGTVYVAHDPVLGRMVAIKVFAGDLDVPDARERFSREARAAAALNHPNIVTVYDFGEFASQPYIVMEYVPGETLANVIRRKVAVSLSEKLRWIEDLCAGAGYAHQMSVVHRDIKPANLVVDRTGRLKILDFGIARLLGIASNTAVMIGTPGYMAPEQITGDLVDHRSDQFSIGVVFYELLAYAEPFPGDTLPMITHRIVSQEPTPLEQLVPEVPLELVAIVSQALKKSAAHRFRDTESMRLAISRVRRRFETDADWSAPTSPVGRDSGPVGSLNRGTGSARSRTNDSVGVAELTPPPDPRRTDREALARRRTAQVDAALLLAKTLFEQRDLDAALDACQQALTLDETHVAALELEGEIQTAIRTRDGIAVAADNEAAPSADGPTMFDPLSSGRSRMFESQAVTRYGDGAFGAPPPPASIPPSSIEKQPTNPSAAPVPPVPSVPAARTGVGERSPDEKTAERLPAAVSADATIISPPHRTPAPASAPAAAAQRAAVPAAQPAAAKANVEAPAMKPAKAPAQNDEALQAIGPAVKGAPQAGKQKAVALAAGAGVLLLAIGSGVFFLMTRGPAPPGTMIIDAVPWATVTSVRNERGEPQELTASPASTPLALTLPAGTYQITLTGPPPESKTETVSVQVDAGGTSVVPLTRFQRMTAEEYFEQYIGAGDAPGVETAAPAESGAAPAAAHAPGQGAAQ
jgi:serine/threonine protein kinase